MSTIYVGGKTYKEHVVQDDVFRCAECAGPNKPTAERCQYCGFYFKNPEPIAEIAAEATVEQNTYSGYTSTTGNYLKSVVFFSIVLLVTTIMGSVFTNGTIQADFTTGAVMAASILGLILFLGAVKLVNL
jgi:hypothetical protein